MTPKSRRVVLGILGGLILLVAVVISRLFCFSAWFRYGVSLDECPDGRPRQTLAVWADGLRRDAAGSVRVGALAHYTTRGATEDRQVWIGRLSPALFLVRDGKETPLTPKKGWERSGTFSHAEIVLPQVPDGDYLLRAKVQTPLEEGTLDVRLPVFAPARVHVLTDRPLYEPGNTVKFRAVALRAKDLAPLDGRPGIWSVVDPAGEVLLEERSPAGAWGVASGTFPLDGGAASGTWRVRWISGDATGEAAFDVRPFTLPRFKVEASANKAFYLPGDTPIVRGSVTYSSGAPVVGASVALSWNVNGEWPPPTSWMDGGLPKTAAVDKGGRFTLELPEVPADLRGEVSLSAALEATDPAGDRATGAVAARLAQEAIKIAPVTELPAGLVEGFNNRLYLRVTDAGGMVLPKAELTVKRAWDPSDKGIVAQADEDGVASLQIDPGPAVNVVIPPMPYRPRPGPKTVSLNTVTDLLTDQDLSLADRKILDGWLGVVEPCARFVASGDSDSTEVGLRVDGGGAVLAVGTDGRALSRCVGQALKDRRLAPGPERLLQLGFVFGELAMPAASVSLSGIPGVPEGLQEALDEAAAEARPCLPRNLNEELELERFLTWRTQAKSKKVAVSWATLPKGEARRLKTDACFEGKFREVELPSEPEGSQVGLARFTATPYVQPGEERPQATTMLGYEFAVSAKIAGEAVGSAKLRLTPGSVPPIRLRASPVLAVAGGELKVEILRGPDFRGALPEELTLVNEGRTQTAKTDKDHRSVVFKIDPAAEGWLQVGWGGAQALAYVAPKASLAVGLRAEQERYAPGQTARLRLTTTSGERGVPAAIGLFGVDESLEQLAPLPGADAMVGLRPQATMTVQPFGALDAQALAMGRVRGGHAAAAIVSRVSAPPAPAELDKYVSAALQAPFTPIEELTDAFYTVLTELHAQTRAWEQSAPATERMHPKTMAELWKKASDACEKRGEKVRDAYGRVLRLSHLPQELLSLVDPRAVVVVGTRLPEDVEPWTAWVAKEEP